MSSTATTPSISGASEPPAFTTAEAAATAATVFGVHGAAATLPSERDQNFLITAVRGAQFVLKIAQAGEDRALLECQNAALDRLAAVERFRFSRPLRAIAGERIGTVRDARGREHYVRMVDYLPGVPLATVRYHSPSLLEQTGALLGLADRALLGFDHPAARRDFYWDLRHGRSLMDEQRHHIADTRRRALIERYAAQFDALVAPPLSSLRRSVIHGDGNDWNILVDDVGDPLVARRIVGLLDLGDMVHTWLVAEPAIACAYAMLDKVDPLAAAADLVRGFHRELPLTEAELEALFPLICLRLCMSVVLAARQRQRFPDNEYLSVSEAPAWQLLERLESVHPRFAHYVFRAACGLPACPQTAAVTSWLGAHGARIGPVLEQDVTAAGALVLDLTVGTTEFDDLAGRADAAAWTDAIFRRMRAAGVSLALGRYDEPRGWYTDELFRVATDEGSEWRTVHIGVDLFAAPGTPVLAPLDGVVHAVRDNAGRQDYGPTLILRHEFDHVVFYTLFGHLAGDVLELSVGAPITAGQTIGHVGDFPRNGDWAPHLHLQLIVDLLDQDGTFPGVARPSQRAVWRSLSPDPNLLLRNEVLAATVDTALTFDQIVAVRARHIGRNLSISYRRPLHIVRGWMQHLYDADGQAFLDCVNNVAHVGHCHPRVVAALVKQSRVLNTNTRYLHENLVRYAERLTATLPEPLSVCFFVCSGSEANELALRLARTVTARDHVIVLDAAYHGNTDTLVGLSPYKFNGAGGAGQPRTTHVVPLPDPYRGPHRGDAAGQLYAQYVQDITGRVAGRDVAALLVESLPGCGGQIVLPDGFLTAAFAHVRSAGGVCIADEVQVGFGRVGTHFWGFETQGVVPDIVTMGKPIGNGHPLGAVVTTPEIAAAFANGMEYFNTFGGNPVSCAVGLAVLDVIAAEGLQAHALEVGEQLMKSLRSLLSRHPLIGDVRGSGLYIGVELVLDRDSLAPAPRHAAYIIERMRDHGILLSTDGPLHNVIKIKPPLPFSAADAERLASTLDRVLGELPAG